MNIIRVFTNPRRCEQRFGFLKYLVWRASFSASNNLANLGKDLIDTVSSKIYTVLTPHLQEYIKNVLTDSIYRDLRSLALKPIDKGYDRQKLLVEVQDLYLSSHYLPSRRGKLVKDNWNRYPQLAVDLGLLRKGTYSLMVRGFAFLSLTQESERKAFQKSEAETISVGESSNPFQLTLPQKLLLIFSFIENDGDMLTKVYQILLTFHDSFPGTEAGNYLPEIYRDIAAQLRSKARSGDDFTRVQKFIDTASKIEAVKQKTNPGGKNSREHAITVRLEPFVDFGLLSKPNPFLYYYQTTNVTSIFFEKLLKSENIEHFLYNSFFATSNQALDIKGKHCTDREILLPCIQKAYDILKSPLGYVPILEVCLLSAIHSITGVGTYFEVSEGIEMLKSLQKEKPNVVTFNADRFGALHLVKFTENIFEINKS